MKSMKRLGEQVANRVDQTVIRSIVPRFYAAWDNDYHYGRIFERFTGPGGTDRLMADKIPTTSWMEVMVEWMNTLELTAQIPELKVAGGHG